MINLAPLSSAPIPNFPAARSSPRWNSLTFSKKPRKMPEKLTKIKFQVICKQNPIKIARFLEYFYGFYWFSWSDHFSKTITKKSHLARLSIFFSQKLPGFGRFRKSILEILQQFRFLSLQKKYYKKMT